MENNFSDSEVWIQGNSIAYGQNAPSCDPLMTSYV